MAKRRSKGIGNRFVFETGIADLDRKLSTLPDRIRKKVVRQAMRKAINLVTTAARANVRKGGASSTAGPGDSPYSRTGVLRRSIKTRAAKIRGATVAVGTIVARGDGGSSKAGKFYGGPVEYGTARTAPHPFMGPAADSEGPKARALARAEIIRGVDRESSRG